MNKKYLQHVGVLTPYTRRKSSLFVKKNVFVCKAISNRKSENSARKDDDLFKMLRKKNHRQISTERS